VSKYNANCFEAQEHIPKYESEHSVCRRACDEYVIEIGGIYRRIELDVFQRTRQVIRITSIRTMTYFGRSQRTGTNLVAGVHLFSLKPMVVFRNSSIVEILVMLEYPG
jgi:hypothetical protein